MVQLRYRYILNLAIPSIVANITTPLLSLVDTAIAGHLGSAAYLAAIAVGSSMFNMIYFLFAFLRMGTSGRTAQAFGANNRSEENRVLGRSIFTAMTISVVILIFHAQLWTVGMYVLDPDVETESMARTYYMILIYGAPAVLVNYSFYGWLIGMQRSRDTMIISIVVNVVNIAFSYAFVYVFNFGIEGIALGTLTAQWTGAVIGWVMVRKNGFEIPPARGFFAGYAIEGQDKNVNVDIFLRTMCLVCVTVWFTRIGASQGALMLAVNSLLMQFFIVFSYFMDGFAFAGEALAGKYVGARNPKGLRQTVAKLLNIGAVMALLFTIGYLLFGNSAIYLLSGDMEVCDAASDYRLWSLAIPVAGFVAFVMDGVFIGMTRTRHLLFSLVAGGIVFFSVLGSAEHTMGNNALWLAFILYLATRGAYLYALCRRIIYR